MEHKLVSFVSVVAFWTLIALLINLAIRLLQKWKYIRYLHMTHNPLRFWGVTSRRNVWYHDKN